MAALERRLRPERAGLAARPLSSDSFSAALNVASNSLMRGMDVRSRSRNPLFGVVGIRRHCRIGPSAIIDDGVHHRRLARKIAIGGRARDAGGFGNIADRGRQARLHQPRWPSPASACGCAPGDPRIGRFVTMSLEVIRPCQNDTHISNALQWRRRSANREAPTGRALSDVQAAVRRREGALMQQIYVVGTADTKGEELAYLAQPDPGLGPPRDRRCGHSRSPRSRSISARREVAAAWRRAPSPSSPATIAVGGGRHDGGVCALRATRDDIARHSRHRRRRRHGRSSRPGCADCRSACPRS